MNTPKYWAFCFWQDLEQNITNSISANIESYAISIVSVESAAPEMNVTIMAHDLSSSIQSTCKFLLEDLTEVSAISYSYIYVKAKNVLFDGYSEKKICTNTPISKK